LKGLSLFIAALALTPLWTAIVHALLMRAGLKRMQSRQMTALISSAVLAPVLAVVLWHLYLGGLEAPERLTASLYAILVFCLMSYTYFHFFNMSETARRIKMVIEISKSDGLPCAALRGRYNARLMVDNRIERLKAAGQICEKDGRFRLNARLIYYAALIVEWWGDLLGLPAIRERQGRGSS